MCTKDYGVLKGKDLMPRDNTITIEQQQQQQQKVTQGAQQWPCECHIDSKYSQCNKKTCNRRLWPCDTHYDQHPRHQLNYNQSNLYK